MRRHPNIAPTPHSRFNAPVSSDPDPTIQLDQHLHNVTTLWVAQPLSQPSSLQP